MRFVTVVKLTTMAAVAVLALAPLAAVPAYAADDTIVATINGNAITEADLKVAEAEIGSDMGSMPEDQKRMSLLEFLIDNQLFAEAAEEVKLGQGPEFETRLKYLRRRALREMYFEKVIKGAVSDADARKMYDDQVKLLKPEEEINARHILVESEAKAKEIKAALDKGGDFAKLAKENSKDPGSKDNGGDLGYFGRGQMVPQFEQVVFTLKPGEISAPLQTQFGWHIVKVEDRRKKQPPAFDIVKDRIVQSMLLQKAQQSAVSLRSKAKIEFLDPGIKTAIDARNKLMEQSGQMTEPKNGDDAKAEPAAAAPAAKETKKPE